MKRPGMLAALLIAVVLAVPALAVPAVAGGGTPVYRWVSQASGTTDNFNAVDAYDANHVWAVGNDGIIRFFDGTSWRAQATGLTTKYLFDVQALDPSHVWAVGEAGTVLFFNGLTWAPFASPDPDNIVGIYVYDASHIWVAGGGGPYSIFFYNGHAWSTQRTGIVHPLNCISGCGASDIWVGGGSGELLRYMPGLTWEQVPAGTTNGIDGLSALDPHNVWSVTDVTEMLHFDGTSWTVVRTPGSPQRGICAFDASHVWSVGMNGDTNFFDGEIWETQTLGSAWFKDVSACDADHVWAVCNGGTIMFGEPAEKSVWYLAEGTTAWGFSTYISIQNPNATAVHASITYMTGTGNASGGTITLPARSQTTVNPTDVLGQKDFSTRVVCTEGKTIAVDRTMSWTGPGAASPEGHSSVGVTSPAKTWYLPEGSSAWGFECWLLIQNPNAGSANCTVTYMIEGASPVTKTHTVPSNSRQSFNMETDIGQKNASIKVESNIPVIPERAMYRNNKREGHDSIGTTTSAADYFLAEGTTAWGFTTWVLIQNPASDASDVTITYMTPSGKKAQAPFSLPGNSRKTIKVNDVAGMASTDFSTQVHGSKPIIAERAMYWDNGTGEACHDSIGMSSAHTTFYLPDGQTSEGRETWTLVQNPNASDVQVEISYLTPTGTGNVVKTETIPANSRRTFGMLEHSGINGRASIMVTSKTAGKKIMVERAMYWNNKGAGTDTIGGFSE